MEPNERSNDYKYAIWIEKDWCNVPRVSSMTAVGLDLGGSKIEAQIFDADWALTDKRRVDTPKTYHELLNAIGDLVSWSNADQANLPIGIGAAGVLSADGRALTANLPATNHRIVHDIHAQIDDNIVFINDGRAFALSEAVFGAGCGHDMMLGLILGTGVGAGMTWRGELIGEPHSIAGEIGHVAAPLSVCKDLPAIECGCGRYACYEAYASGPGLSRLALHYSGEILSPMDIAGQKSERKSVQMAWEKWCEIVAEMIITSSFYIAPDVVVLGGGLSKIDGAIDDLAIAVDQRALANVNRPKIVLAEAGDASGARGAAYAAYLKGRVG
jgi:N-acetylglucosamine kinase